MQQSVTTRSGTLSSYSPQETRAIGTRLGRAATPGTLLALIGPLGAGKTQLTKGVAQGLGIETVVNSPTFVLMNEHVGRLRLFHVDVYRLSDPEEALAAGLLDEREVEGLAVIEWADRLDGWLPPERLDLELVVDPARSPDERTIAWTAHGDRHARLAAAALEAS
jgi:tRNA threonylcarbamoyladenosine biosynthesis protein TsaE